MSEVFISYARRASREHAVALRDALAEAGIAAFLDTDAIEDGDRFPQRLVDGVLDTRAFVLFADPVYFQRWYCIRELKLALAAYEELVRRGADDAARDAAVAGVVVAMSGGDLRNLPPRLASTQWPPAGETRRLVERVQAALTDGQPTFRERAAGLGALRDHLLQEMAVPPARNLGGETVLVPAGLDPSIGDKFVGRADDLWRLHMTLSTGRAEASVAAALTASIEGGGGFGKTRLAREYLWRFADAYPGGWFWVDADVDDLLLEQRHYDMLKALDGDVPPLRTLRENETPVAPLLAAALRTIPPAEPALLVVDNVPEPKPGEPPSPLQRWCPALGFVTTLVTSRWKASMAMREVATVEVGTLSPEAATLMLRDEALQQLADSEWRELAAWVGHLPLAIEVLNAALRSGAAGSEELLEAARTRGRVDGVDELAKALEGQVPSGALRGIRDALSLTFDKLTPESVRGAGLLAHLGPEPIPTTLVTALGLTRATRIELRARSIVTTVPEEDVELYGRMHRVMADYVRTQTDVTPDAVADALGEVMTDEACQDPGRWPVMFALVPHVERVLEHLHGALPASEVDLRLRLGMLMWSAGLARRAIRFGQAAADQAETELGPQHPETMRAFNNLAGTLSLSGNVVRAQAILERVVAVRRRTLGDEHPDTLMSRTNLAEAVRAAGEPALAVAIMDEVVARYERVLPEDHPDTLSARTTLAKALWTDGDAAASQAIHEQVLPVRRRVLGVEHPDTLMSMNNLAAAVQAADPSRARAILEQVVAVRRRRLGEEHPDTLMARTNLAEALRASGEPAQAVANLHDVVTRYARVLGEEHPDVLSTRTTLAKALWHAGDAAGSEANHERVLAVRQRVLGMEHPDTLMSLNDLAAAVQAADPSRARGIFERVVSARRRTLGEEHPDTIMSMRNLASTLRDLGDHAAAAEWDRRANAAGT